MHHPGIVMSLEKAAYPEVGRVLQWEFSNAKTLPLDYPKDAKLSKADNKGLTDDTVNLRDSERNKEKEWDKKISVSA